MHLVRFVQATPGHAPPLYGSFFVCFGETAASNTGKKVHRPAACVYAWDKGAFGTHVCVTDLSGFGMQRAGAMLRDCPPLTDATDAAAGSVLWIVNARLDYDTFLDIGKSQRESRLSV